MKSGQFRKRKYGENKNTFLTDLTKKAILKIVIAVKTKKHRKYNRNKSFQFYKRDDFFNLKQEYLGDIEVSDFFYSTVKPVC